MDCCTFHIYSLDESIWSVAWKSMTVAAVAQVSTAVMAAELRPGGEQLAGGSGCRVPGGLGPGSIHTAFSSTCGSQLHPGSN